MLRSKSADDLEDPYPRVADRIGGSVRGNSAAPGRSVTSKIVAILLAFRDGDEHSLTDIAQRARLPVSTAHRLLAELTAGGVLERTDESRFRIGLLIKTLGSRRFGFPLISAQHPPHLVAPDRRPSRC